MFLNYVELNYFVVVKKSSVSSSPISAQDRRSSSMANDFDGLNLYVELFVKDLVFCVCEYSSVPSGLLMLLGASLTGDAVHDDLLADRLLDNDNDRLGGSMVE